MWLQRIEVKNVLGVEHVIIEPNGPMIELNGETGTGKTSVIRAVRAALGGRSEVPTEFLRKGSMSGKVELTFADDDGNPELIATLRQWIDPQTEEKSDLKFSLTEARGGQSVRAPQTYLNDIGVKLGIDFLGFLKMKPTEQVDALRRVLDVRVVCPECGGQGWTEQPLSAGGSDLDGENEEPPDVEQVQCKSCGGSGLVPDGLAWLDSQIAKAEESRRDNGREVKRIEGSVATLAEKVAEYDNIPDDEVSSADLVSQIESAQEANRNREIVQQNQLDFESDIVRIKGELEGAMRALEDNTALLSSLPPIVDTTPMKERLRSIDETNAKVRDKKSLADLHRQLGSARDLHQKDQDDIERLRGLRDQAFRDADMPVDGMSLDADGIRVNGIPLEQCSGIEQLHIAMEIALRQKNNHLPLLIADEGDQLGGVTVAVIRDALEKRGAQLLFTTRHQVTSDPFVLEGGRVLVNGEEIKQ